MSNLVRTGLLAQSANRSKGMVVTDVQELHEGEFGIIWTSPSGYVGKVKFSRFVSLFYPTVDAEGIEIPAVYIPRDEREFNEFGAVKKDGSSKYTAMDFIGFRFTMRPTEWY